MSVKQGQTGGSIKKYANKSVLHRKIKSKCLKTRRGKRFSQKKVINNLIFAGVNPAGVRSKWPTWVKIINQSGARLWTMQETKSAQANQLKMEDFIIYERIRSEQDGGGVAIGAKKDLNPVLIAEGEENVEAISIDITLAKIKCSRIYQT